MVKQNAVKRRKRKKVALPAAAEQVAETFLESAKRNFAPFLAANPASKIIEIADDDGIIVISDPWGDPSLAIEIPENDRALRDTMNSIFLPERYTAIWHRDTKDLEIIWTAYPLNPLWHEIPGRTFAFSFAGKEHECFFGASSQRLITLAASFRPMTASSTFFRNLESYRTHALLLARRAKNHRLPPPFTEPRSFWIKNLEWNDDKVLALINDLNFYLTYYDAVSPHMVIHAAGEPAKLKPQTRYSAGAFPKVIDGKGLDDVLVQLWMASRGGDESTRFLYCFRILEYASFSYLDGKARLDIRRILAAPDARDNIDRVTEKVVSALQKANLDDFPKCEALLEDVVKPELLWREINVNLDAFTKPTTFDGGYVQKPLVGDGINEGQFALKGIQNFHRAIRDIRNALAHGKDTKTAGVITPTVRNFERLRPWVSLISVAAGEVIVLKDAV